MSDRPDRPDAYAREAPRRHGRRLGWPELSLAVGVAALVLLAFSAVGVVLVRYELVQRADALQSEIASLEDEHTRLRQELEWSRSSAGIERLARQALGWSRPGETVVAIPDLPTPRPSPGPTPTPGAPSWRALWGLLPGP
jgi:cell division protein FtsB